MSIGLALSERYYRTVVERIVAAAMPRLHLGAARLGDGSEVLGFDTPMSADHNYGPCVQLFIPRAGFRARAARLMAAFDRELPEIFEGWPVRFQNTGRALPGTAGALCADHGVEIFTLESWTRRQLGVRPDATLTALDWLAMPEQRLLTVTAGAVFRDDYAALAALRQRLAWFPRDVWLIKLAAQWARIGEEQAFVGRTGDNGDDLGSRIIAARRAHDIMRLCFLIERRYAPYPKWFGAAFALLESAAVVGPLLDAALTTADWRERQKCLAEACGAVAELQLRHGVPGAAVPVIAGYFERPFLVVNTDALVAGLTAAIEDQSVRHLAIAGGTDQFCDATPILMRPARSRRILRASLE